MSRIFYFGLGFRVGLGLEPWFQYKLFVVIRRHDWRIHGGIHGRCVFYIFVIPDCL